MKKQASNHINTDSKKPVLFAAGELRRYSQRIMTKYANWDQLNNEIKSCELCEGMNSKKLGTLNAPGYGDKASNLVFIGQSLCGKPCIDAQIPFTGGSGRILDQAFQQENIKKENIYITNVVKCHPDFPYNNRKSKLHEITNCTPYLKQELSWISPKEVVCLGKDAWGFFDKDIPSPCTREVIVEGQRIKIHFVYHPSYIMKQPKKDRESYMRNLVNVIESSLA